MRNVKHAPNDLLQYDEGPKTDSFKLSRYLGKRLEHVEYVGALQGNTHSDHFLSHVPPTDRH